MPAPVLHEVRSSDLRAGVGLPCCVRALCSRALPITPASRPVCDG